MREGRCDLRLLLTRMADCLDRLDRKLVPPVEPLVVPLDRAAELLAVSRATVERMIRAGRLASMRVAGRRMVPVAALVELARG